MSWVAAQNATNSAQSATRATSVTGSLKAMASRPAAIPDWASSIQLRRRPSRPVSTGRGVRSTTGAQITLMEYMMPIQLKKPISVRLMSASRSHTESVEKISRNGRPAENPRNSMAITRGWR